MDCDDLKAVEENGYFLCYIRNQTPEICLAAVKQNGFALQYVNEQTPEICLAAIKQNGWALIYAKEQTEDLCLEAIRKCPYSLKLVKNQTFKIINFCLQYNLENKKYIKLDNLSHDEIEYLKLKYNVFFSIFI